MAINIKNWDVEDPIFWKEKGSKIAIRNILVSIPALLLAFAVWIMWGIIITKMKEFGYNFGLMEGTTPIRSASSSDETRPDSLPG